MTRINRVDSVHPVTSVILLTQGDRPVELARAVERVRAQHLPAGERLEIVLVVNGGTRPELPPASDLTVLELPENVGIPAGRNAGWRASTGDLVVVLDDDGWLPDDDTLDHVRVAFAAEPDLGILAFRIADPITGRTARRHVPRLRASDPLQPGDVTTFLGGAWAIRRVVLDQTGGLPGAFFFSHEETDLAWRALDRGWRIHYDPDAVLFHPTTSPARHALYYRTNARNRVWLARRNLPAPLAAAYLGTWIALTLARVRNTRALRTWFGGLREGLRTDPGERRVMRWSTVWRMTRMGRPPVI